MLPYSLLIVQDTTQFNQIISRLNTCLGLPIDQTLTWQENPLDICLFDLNNGDKTSIGLGIIINNQCFDCLTQEEKNEVIAPAENINICDWVPPTPSGSTQNNIFDIYFSGTTF